MVDWTVVVVVVCVTIGSCFLSDRMTAAVKAAPVPALTAAMIARVVFDILDGTLEKGGRFGHSMAFILAIFEEV